MAAKQFWTQKSVLFVLICFALMILSHQSELSPSSAEPSPPRAHQNSVVAPPSTCEIPAIEEAPGCKTFVPPKSNIPTWTSFPQQGHSPPPQDPAITRPLVALSQVLSWCWGPLVCFWIFTSLTFSLPVLLEEFLGPSSRYPIGPLHGTLLSWVPGVV